MPPRLPAWLLSLVLAIAAASSLAADDPVDQLDQPALQEAFRILKSDYIRQDAFSYEEINRAALDGLLRRLQFGAELVPASRPAEPTAGPSLQFHEETLTPTVGYLRFSSYGEDELPLLDEALAQFQKDAVKTLILDLRVPASPDSLEPAARILDRFVSPNTILFKIQRPREDRPRLFVSQVTDVRWIGALIVLIDEDCSAPAELIAAVLRRQRAAFLTGAPTPGLTVEFEEIPLTETLHLRFAVAEIVLDDGSSLFRQGLTPNFPVATDLPKKHRIFAASQHAPLRDFLLDRARPRMNEAALVQETDPELDYYVARANGEKTVYDQIPLQDQTLQRALDLLLTLDFVAPPAAPQDPL